MNKLASCHKALPIAILLALLVCGYSQTSSAQLRESLSASASGSLGGGSNGGISGQVGADASLSGGGGGGGSAQAQITLKRHPHLSGGLSASASGSLGGGSSGGISGQMGADASMGGGSHSGGFGGGSGLGASGSIISGSEGSGGVSGSASSSASLSTVASTGSAQSYAPSTPKPEGMFSKMKDMVKTSVDSLTKDDKKEQQKEQQQQSGSVSMTAGASLSSGESGGQKSGGLMDKLGDVAKRGKEMVKETAEEVKDGVKSMLKPSESSGGASAEAKVQMSGGTAKEGPIAKLMNKGQEMVHKASEIGKEITKPLTGGVKADAQIKIGGVKAQVGSAKGNEKGLAVDVLDKVHEMSKAPVEHALKPIDKALGYKEDPIVKAIDQTATMLRKPVSDLAKPVESILSGAFHTSEEARAEQERLLSEQERREMRLREEKARKEGRSVLGQITDKTVELYEKPIEIILKPVDRVFGFDKKGKKNPLLKLIDTIYGLSKKPIDALAKPLEKILRKMAEGEQAYQVSVRFAGSGTDPKLFTRLADGALNIADRVVTRPIEFAMRPLGYDQKKRRNPIVDAAHSLKNATRIGLELLMKPLDRIIKEIAELGDIKDEAEREAEFQRKRQEASRIVAALDKLHEIAQQPFEIVLKPVGKALGYNKDGKKDPMLRTWTFLHQVAMTPLQVVSKPLEDAILGESKQSKLNVNGELKVGQAKVTAKASVGGAQGGAKATASVVKSERRKNLFVEGIKKVEKFATKPIDVITSPIRRLILGEDDKIGGKEFKAKLGPIQASANIRTSGNGKDNQPDKIVKTIEKINNVVLKPLELMTQPISDTVTTDEGKLKSKIDVNVQGATHMRGQEKAQASMLASASGSKVSASASGSVSGPGSGQAQVSGS